MKKGEAVPEIRAGWAVSEAGKAEIKRREEHRKTCAVCAAAYERMKKAKP